MSKIYKSSEIEVQAKRLLAPIQVSCSDALWQQLNYKLDEQYTSREKTWKNSLSTPKTLGIAIACICLIVVSAWKLLPMINNASYSQAQAPVVITKVQKPAVITKTEPPANKPAVVTVTNNDSIAKANAAKDSIQKQAEAAQLAIARAAYWAKRDSIRRRMNLLAMSSHKDSASANHASATKDTIVKVHTRRMAYDSVASVLKDTANKP